MVIQLPNGNEHRLSAHRMCVSSPTRYGAQAAHQLHVAQQLLTSFDSTGDQLAHNRVHGEGGGAGG